MILLHRLTPFVVAVLVATSYVWLFLAGSTALLPVFILFIITGFLIARLLNWEGKSFSFWVFLAVPLFFFFSSLFFYIFLEADFVKIVLAMTVVAGAWLYAENLFTFYHLPGSYQAYALEYLTLVLYILSAFFFTSAAYAAQLFMQLPVWVPALAVFWVVLAATIAVFWVSKVTTKTSVRFAVSGAVLLTELYMVLAALPTSFLTNAAIFSIFLYVFLGMSRAQALKKLSKTVLRRYLTVSASLLFIVLLTAKWI